MDHTFSHDVLVDGVKPGNQFILATVAGVIMALLCTLIWPVVAFLAGPQVDSLAVGAGILIGLSIRFSGNGTHPVYGALAMVLTLVSSMTGNILGVIASTCHEHLDIFGAIQMVSLGDVVISILTQATLSTYLLFAAGVALSCFIAVKK